MYPAVLVVRETVNTLFLALKFGLDIGGVLYGPWFRYTILASITISQLGFVASYTIFVAENFRVRCLDFKFPF